MEDVDNAAKKYISLLLNDENQEKIRLAMSSYKFSETEKSSDFKKILKQRIREKQTRYDNLLANLSTGSLPPSVVSDVGKEMETLKSEIECLKNTKPPQSFNTGIIYNWLESIRNSPNEEAVRMLIERIEVKTKTSFKVESTLKKVLGKNGCGGWI